MATTCSTQLSRAPCKYPNPASAPPIPAVRLHPTIRPTRRANLSVSHSVHGRAAAGTLSKRKLVYDYNESRDSLHLHEGSTFVVVISSEILSAPYLDFLFQDISLLHRNPTKIVLVPEIDLQIDKILEERGKKGKYVGCYRVTDSDSLEAAKEAYGRTYQMIEANLSSRLSEWNLRPWKPDPGVASGDFLEAKRKRVIEGVDYGATGEVKKINHRQIREGLERDCVVVVSNLGYSSTGDVLNCNTYEVATACAIALQAEKLICIVDGQLVDEQGQPVHFMTSEDVDMLIAKRAKQGEVTANYFKAVGEEDIDYSSSDSTENMKGFSDRYNATFKNGIGFYNGNGILSGELGSMIAGQERMSSPKGYFPELAAATFVCRGGIHSAHLVDGTIRGALLDGLLERAGTMVSSDLDVHDGIRVARVLDLPGIKKLIRPLEKTGALVRRTHLEYLETLKSFIVVESDGSVIACAAFIPFFWDKYGVVDAFAVAPESPERGDKLLDYIENKASSLGLEKLLLVTTSSADWFVRRGFAECSSEPILMEKRRKVCFAQGSSYFVKEL